MGRRRREMPGGRIGRCNDKRRPHLQRRSGAGRMWASVRLRKQRRAFTMEIMSTKTVVYKSIKSTGGVKYPTKKDLARGATLILLVSCGTWGSWVSETLGVRNPGCPKPSGDHGCPKPSGDHGCPKPRAYFDPSGLMRYMGIMGVRNPGCPKPWVSETLWGSWVSETLTTGSPRPRCQRATITGF